MKNNNKSEPDSGYICFFYRQKKLYRFKKALEGLKIEIIENVTRIFTYRTRLILCTFAITLLSACGGGSSSGTSASSGSTATGAGASQTPQTTDTGYFIDSPVSGLEFKTASQTGITGKLGTFQYVPGETVQFSLGNVVIGSVPTAKVITPIQLIKNSSASTAEVVNRVRFLMMLDSDDNVKNGISIPDSVRQAAKKWSLNFTSSSFDSDVASIITDLDNIYQRTVTLPSISDAQTHLQRNFDCAFSGVMTGSYTGSSTGKLAIILGDYTGKIVGSGIDDGTGKFLIGGLLNADYAFSTSFDGNNFGANFSANLARSGDNLDGTWSLSNQSGTWKMARQSLTLSNATGTIFRGAYDGQPNSSSLNKFYQTAGYFKIAIDNSGNVKGVGFSTALWQVDPSKATYNITGSLANGTLSLQTTNNDQFSVPFDGKTVPAIGNWNSLKSGDHGYVVLCENPFDNNE